MTWLLVAFAIGAGLFLLFFAWALMRAIPDDEGWNREAQQGIASPDEEDPR